jgi:phospho-N-acetylmuramoyl-pentapeptide-transferase
MALSLRIFGAFSTALILGLVGFPSAIRLLRRRQLEQSLRDRSEVRTLADLHAAKAHTPTLGGIFIWATTLLSTLLWGHICPPTAAVLCVFSAFAILGLADDLQKILTKSSRGISGRRRLFAAGIIVCGLLGGIYLWDRPLYGALHELWIPLRSTPLLNPMPLWLLLPFAYLVVVGCANGANLTDGLDGLAAGCGAIATSALIPLGVVAASVSASSSAGMAHVPGADELTVLLGAFLGSLLAFLRFNRHPARIFMGDTGSLAMGSLLGTVALLLRQPFTLAIVGGVFVAETLSVVAQVYYYKWTRGRRLFRMAPLHHHFELGGWPERRVVTFLWAIALLCSALGLALPLAGVLIQTRS